MIEIVAALVILLLAMVTIQSARKIRQLPLEEPRDWQWPAQKEMDEWERGLSQVRRRKKDLT